MLEQPAHVLKAIAAGWHNITVCRRGDEPAVWKGRPPDKPINPDDPILLRAELWEVPGA